MSSGSRASVRPSLSASSSLSMMLEVAVSVVPTTPMLGAEIVAIKVSVGSMSKSSMIGTETNESASPSSIENVPTGVKSDPDVAVPLYVTTPVMAVPSPLDSPPSRLT